MLWHFIDSINVKFTEAIIFFKKKNWKKKIHKSYIADAVQSIYLKIPR